MDWNWVYWCWLVGVGMTALLVVLVATRGSEWVVLNGERVSREVLHDVGRFQAFAEPLPPEFFESERTIGDLLESGAPRHVLRWVLRRYPGTWPIALRVGFRRNKAGLMLDALLIGLSDGKEVSCPRPAFRALVKRILWKMCKLAMSERDDDEDGGATGAEPLPGVRGAFSPPPPGAPGDDARYQEKRQGRCRRPASQDRPDLARGAQLRPEDHCGDG